MCFYYLIEAEFPGKNGRFSGPETRVAEAQEQRSSGRTWALKEQAEVKPAHNTAMMLMDLSAFAQQNESGGERQTPNGFTDMRNLKTKQTNEQTKERVDS